MISLAKCSIQKVLCFLFLTATACHSYGTHSHHHQLHNLHHKHHHSNHTCLEELDSWLFSMAEMSRIRIFENISPEGSEPGCVIASPSKHDPDYFYYWVRDGALTMDTLAILYEQAEPGSAMELELEQKFKDYIHFVKKIIRVQNRSGHVGEPKYHVTATAFDNDWGRPQNDGPPLQANVFMNFYRIYSAKGNADPDVLKDLYDPSWPNESLIKFHLEHTAEHWHRPSFDLWEEVYGDHFWTKMVQRKALIMGETFALEMGDKGAANHYANQIAHIEGAILNHWDQNKNSILENLQQGTKNTVSNKQSGLDVGTVLAALRGGLNDQFFTPEDDRVLSTVYHFMKAMKQEYKLNHEHHSSHLGIAFGRYPEDVYDGHGFTLGNPWYLATNAVSELLFKVGQKWAQSKHILVTLSNQHILKWLGQRHEGHYPSAGTIIHSSDKLFSDILNGIQREGDAILLMVKSHVPSDGRLSEQFHRVTGHPQGARDLTWSYSSILEVVHQRNIFRSLHSSQMAESEE